MSRHDVYDLFRPLDQWCYICQRPHPDCDPDRFDIPCPCTLEQSCPEHMDDDDDTPSTTHPYETPTLPAFSPGVSEQRCTPGTPHR